MKSMLDILKRVNNKDYEVIDILLDRGTLEIFSKVDKNITADTIVFTDEEDIGYSYTTITKTKSKKKTIVVKLTTGDKVVADSYYKILSLLTEVKIEYNKRKDYCVTKNEYIEAAKWRDAITEVNEKIALYEQKQGENSEEG